MSADDPIGTEYPEGDFYAARTCIELDVGDGQPSVASEARPLSEWRDAPAYVLLGDAGAGKSTEFTREWRELGDGAVFRSAREFVTFEPEPDWSGKTLFIDGLDEIRAGADKRPWTLDQVRQRLKQLGMPRFRISCREADWLGSNDRIHLAAVAPDRSIRALRLNPLTQKAAADLLATRLGEDDGRVLAERARRHGIGTMLTNPLTLDLLVAAFADSDSGGPHSRYEVFETACSRMAREHNREHRAGAQQHPVGNILTAAGELCARQLLTGIEGFSTDVEVEYSSFVSVDTLGRIESGSAVTHPELWIPALRSKLFVARSVPSETESVRLVPRHRQVAEFLAGRFLGELIDAGLSARRVVAHLMTPSGDGVATSLRGLSAWLAVHSRDAFDLLVVADPVGVGLYGDISRTTIDQRHQILRCLAAEAKRGPLMGHQWRNGREFDYRDNTAWAFRALAVPQTVDAIRELLTGRGEEVTSDRIAWFLLEVLATAGDDHLRGLGELAPLCEDIARNDARDPQTRWAAIEAYLHVVPVGPRRNENLARLLKDIEDRQVNDPDGDLAGVLLGELYPDVIGPDAIWRCLGLRGRSNYYGRLERFWNQDLRERSSPEMIGELLDDLCENASEVVPTLQSTYLDGVPLELLADALETLGDEPDLGRLFGWLNVVGNCSRDATLYSDPSAQEAALEAITGVDIDQEELDQHIEALVESSRPIQQARAWLEIRPDIQKSVFLMWLRTRGQDGPLGFEAYWRCYALLGSRLPEDFGLWCAQQASELADAKPEVARELIRSAHAAIAGPAAESGLTEPLLRSLTRGHDLLVPLVDALCDPSPPDRQTRQMSDRLREQREKNEAKQRARAQDWVQHLRANLRSLRENTLNLVNLDELGRAYFGHATGLEEDADGTERISTLLGGNTELVDAILDALRRAIHRSDLPDVGTIIDVHAKSTDTQIVFPRHAYPVRAGLELLDAEDPDALDGLSDDLKQTALALLYCMPTVAQPPQWHQRWFDQDPELAADVIYRCAARAMLDGRSRLPGLNELDQVEGHGDTKCSVKLRLLRYFPVGGSNRQPSLLDRLLLNALTSPNCEPLEDVITAKLTATSMTVAQRVRWLTAGSLAFGGRHTADLAAFVRGSRKRVEMLADFLHKDLGPRVSGTRLLTSDVDAATLTTLIEVLGAAYPPFERDGVVTVTAEVDAADRTAQMISQLAAMPGNNVRSELERLCADPALKAWHYSLRIAAEQQSIVERDATYRPLTMDDLERTLSGSVPANAADLTALVVDQLHTISAEFRGSATNLWRSFWNVDHHGKPTEPRPENTCRDTLLDMLRTRLPSSAAAIPEAMHAAGTRADIGIRYGSIALPIEIKPSMSPSLWTGLRQQLIEKYSTDSDAGGHGIYVALWFGSDRIKAPRGEAQPSTPEELQRHLEAQLSSEEALKISVFVLDVTKPGGCTDAARSQSN